MQPKVVIVAPPSKGHFASPLNCCLMQVGSGSGFRVEQNGNVVLRLIESSMGLLLVTLGPSRKGSAATYRHATVTAVEMQT
jgi:hypothetical protein